MSTMDVSLRLRLLNQLSRPAGEAERDLKDLKKTAEQLGRVKGGDTLSRGLVDVGRKADAAKTKLGQIEKEADQLRRAIGKTGSGFSNFKTDAAKAETSLAKTKDRADNTRLAIARIGDGFGNLKADAISAEASLKGIEQQSNVTRAAIGRIGDGAFASLKTDAVAAESAIKQIGTAADAADAKLRSLRGWSAGGRGPHSGVGAPGTRMSTIEGAVDQFGLPVAIGAGGAYLAGALPAGAAVVGGAAINAAAGDEQRSDALRVTGEYDEAEQKRIDAILGLSGAKRGVGNAKAQETFGTLISNGVDAKDAATMTDRVIKVGKATGSDPVDVASTTVSLREIMGIAPDKMMNAYESIAVGGKLGKFEVKDVAQHGPSLFAAMANQGSKGMDSVRLTTAIAQSIARVSGSNDEAATSFEAMLTDMVSPDVADRFEKTYGKNIYDIRKNAIANGEDPVIASLRAYKSAVGGDEAKTRDLFRNSKAYEGYAAVFGDFDLILQRMEQMKNAGGVIDKDYEINTGNFNSQKDRLTSNLALNIKTLAAPLLPLLTTMAEKTSSAMETARQNEQNNPLTVAPSYGILEWLTKLAVDPGGEGRPSSFKRFFLGDAADPDFNLRQHMGIGGRPGGDLGTSTGAIPVPTPRPNEFGQAAKEGMAAYNSALSSEGEAAKAEASSIADYIKSVLGFTVSPTISPTFVPPAGAPAAPPAAEKHSSLQQSSNVRLTQNISSPNAKLAAVKARREQSRAIEQARSRSFYDLGPRLA
ncbi:phage tail tape measure protein [Rhizobium pusense]|uniref:phage tail tape measure protein n=1 Tax=Agrobacterium pusense TaxID=648995 RepID=UPI00244CC49B|nr:phage tail tape measure protein [Agrobacterium pusense]MDH1097400.1 phage tail tape measure protein [Agrobacterium pusense]MDH1111230.1 phage tail tape measure protein [Agrobacterium pusense]MDH2193433.1 phage tail tape measure protein [Agrobacterium pusense]